HRQRSHCPHNPPGWLPRERALRRHQLRRNSRTLARSRIFRLRTWGLHRRAPLEAGALAARSPGHPVPRRDRLAPRTTPAEAPEVSGRRRGSSPRRHLGRGGGCLDHQRHQRRSRRRCKGTPVPRGSLPSAFGGYDFSHPASPPAVRERRFREDLYHRLGVVTIPLPPLRDRGHDVILLATRFLTRASADYRLPALVLAPDARARLLAHRWPGNIRELSNTIERAALLAETSLVTAAALDLKEEPSGSPLRPEIQSLDQTMRDHVRAAP